MDDRTVPPGDRRFTPQIPSWRLMAVVGCVALLAIELYRQLNPATFGYHLTSADFHAFYRGAVAVRHGANPFGDAVAWRSQFDHGPSAYRGMAFFTSSYVYAPAFALLLLPFTWVSYPTALVMWDVCNMAFLTGAVYCLVRSTGAKRTALGVLMITTAAAVLSPIRSELYYGQANLFLLFLLSAAVWARQTRRAGLAGVLLGLACVTKPMLLALVIFLLWKREFWFAAISALSFVGLLVVPFLWLGGQAWQDQLTIWQFWSSQYTAVYFNLAPKGVLVRLFAANLVMRPLVVAPALVTLLWLAFAGVVVLLTTACVSALPMHRDARSLLEIGLVLVALMFVSPLTEDLYLTLLVIPLFALYNWLRQADWLTSSFRLVAGCTLVLWPLLCVPWRQVYMDLWLRSVGSHSALADVYMVLAAGIWLSILLAFFALQIYVLRLPTEKYTTMTVRGLITEAPALSRAWLRDAWAAAMALSSHVNGHSRPT